MAACVVLSNTTTPAAAPTAAEPEPAALPVIRSSDESPVAATSTLPLARTSASLSTRARVSVVSDIAAAEPARPAEPPTPRPMLVTRRSSCEEACRLTLRAASTCAAAPMLAWVCLDSTLTSLDAPTPTEPPPPPPPTTSNSVVLSLADRLTF